MPLDHARAPRPAARRTPGLRALLRRARRQGTVAVVLSLLAGPLLAVAVAPAASAAITSPFERQFVANTNGDVVVVGNTLLSCADGASTGGTSCAAARAGTGGALNNNDWSMTKVDVDGDATTTSSSSATLTLPPSGGVLYAALVWGARTAGATGGAAAPSPAARGTVKLKVPGSSAYTTLTDPAPLDGQNTAYQGWVDVTDRVRAAGSGSYTVADPQIGTGTDRYAGWSLVVAVADPDAPARNLSVFKGFGTIAANGTDQVADISVSGFLTPAQGDVRTTVGVVGYEGDRGYDGDHLQLRRQGRTEFVDVSDAANPRDNVWNSTVSARGTDGGTRSPSYPNQLGFDADTLVADGLLGNDETSATIRLTTTQETYYPGAVTFATDLYEPQLEGAKRVQDVDGGALERGDVLRYTVPVSNTGLDTAASARIVDAIPSGTTYVPGSLQAGSGTGPSDAELVFTPVSDAEGDDRGTYGTGPNGGFVQVTVGEGATATTGGRVPPASTGGTTHHALRFDVTVDGDVADGARLLNVAELLFRGATTGASSTSVSNAVTSVVDGTAPAGPTPLTTSPDVATLRPTPSTPTVQVPVLGNDGGDGLTVVEVTDAAGGRVTLDGGTVTYRPAAAFAGRDAFTYTVRDAHGATAAQVVYVDVVNDAPVATDDAATTTRNGEVLVPVLANDTDANGDALHLVSAGAPGHGTAVVDGAGVRYTPARGWTGTDSFTYVVSDARGSRTTATTTVTVTNRAPVAVADSAETVVDEAVVVPVLANDTDADGDALSVVDLVQPASGGTVSLRPDGTVRLEPAAGTAGTVTFTYRVTDGLATSAPATVTVVVQGPPVAAPDTLDLATGQAGEVDVVANDSDPNAGDTPRLTAVTGAVEGADASVLDDHRVRYTPAPGFAGTDELTYTVTDGTRTATGTLTVTVRNAVPVARDDAAGTPVRTPVDVDVLANDTDANVVPGGRHNQTLVVVRESLRVLGDDARASVALTDEGLVRVVPAAGTVGEVRVAYVVDDGAGGTADAVLTVTVSDRTPVAADDLDAATDTYGVVDVDVLGNDTDPDGDALRVTAVGTPVDADGTPRGTAELVSTPEGPRVRYTAPRDGWAGPVRLSYTVTDAPEGEPVERSASAVVGVEVRNEAPDAGPVLEEQRATAGPLVVDPLGGASDANVPATPGQELTWRDASADGAVDLRRTDDGLLEVVPRRGARGLVTVTWTVADGAGGEATGSLELTLTNTPPTAVDDALELPADAGATVVPVLDNDSDANGDELAVTAVGRVLSADVPDGRAAGTVELVDGVVRLTPTPNFAGRATVTYTVSDGEESATATVTLTVANTPPTAPVSLPTVVDPDVPAYVDVVGRTTDPNVGPTTQRLAVDLTRTRADRGAAVDVAADGRLRVTPVQGTKGDVTVTYVVVDGAGGEATGTLVVTVPNLAPALVDDAVETDSGRAVVVPVLDNDRDPNHDTMRLVAVGMPRDDRRNVQGTAVAEGGTVRYTPPAGFKGVVGFTYEVEDDEGLRSQATATVRVRNAAPTAADVRETTRSATPVTVPVDAQDVNGDTLRVLLVDGDEGLPRDARGVRQGTAAVVDGRLVYTPPTGFRGVVTFPYVVDDGDVDGRASARVTVTVANAAPVAGDDSARTPRGRAVSVDVLRDDTDANGDRLVVAPGSLTGPVDATGTQQGSVTIDDDGRLRWAPPADFVGTVTVTYRADDGTTLSRPATVTLQAVAPPPATQVDRRTTTRTDRPVDVPLDGLTGAVVLVDVEGAEHGTVEVVDGRLVYTPAPGWTGTETFTYTVQDELGQRTTGTVTVTVAGSPVVVPAPTPGTGDGGTGTGSGTGTGTGSATGSGTGTGTGTGTEPRFQLLDRFTVDGPAAAVVDRLARTGADVGGPLVAGGALLLLGAGALLLARRRRAQD